MSDDTDIDGQIMKGSRVLVQWNEGDTDVGEFVKVSGTGYRCVRLESNGRVVALMPEDKLFLLRGERG